MNETGTRYYTDSEIDLLIDDMTEAAREAIEKAAADAAKAASLAAVDREAAALREASLQRTEAARRQSEAVYWQTEAERIKRTGRKNTVLAVVIGILGGLVVGVSGTLLMRN